MDNFYKLLNVSQSADADEIKEAIRREQKNWLKRTSLTQTEKRQEAERMIRVLDEAEAVLLNDLKRKKYDSKLVTGETAPSSVDRAALDQAGDLVSEGWRLLVGGSVADAMYLAGKATRQNPGNADAWALSGQAKFRWNELDGAIKDYRRAIQLRPNEASYYFDLGSVYESCKMWREAYQQYERANTIDPSNTMYRAAIGTLLVTQDQYQEGINILEDCLKEEPDNEVYKWYLAVGYTERAYENWTHIGRGERVPPGYYATEKAQVDQALAYVEKAQQMEVEDKEVRQRVLDVRNDISSMLQRKFQGSWLAALIGIGFGLLMLTDPQVKGTGIYLMVCGILYIIASLTPQYVLNRRIISGKGGSPLHSMLFGGFEGGIGSGCLIFAIGTIIIIAVFPIIIIVNFVRNYGTG